MPIYSRGKIEENQRNHNASEHYSTNNGVGTYFTMCVCLCVSVSARHTFTEHSDEVPDNVSGCLSNRLYTQIVEESMQRTIFQSHKYHKRDINKIW